MRPWKGGWNGLKSREKKRIVSLLAAFLMSVGLAACSSQNLPVLTFTQTVQYGKVSAIDGMRITLMLGTLDTVAQTPSPSDGVKDTAPDGRPADGRIAFMPGSQSIAIDITDAVTLKKQDRGAALGGSTAPGFDKSLLSGSGQGLARETTAELSDIEVGSVLRITYANGVITSVGILSL
jgi:hypothetical protein